MKLDEYLTLDRTMRKLHHMTAEEWLSREHVWADVDELHWFYKPQRFEPAFCTREEFMEEILDDIIDEWHDVEKVEAISLQNYLGFSDDEFDAWARYGTLPKSFRNKFMDWTC